MTSYRRWIAILALMIVGLVIYMIVGFNEDATRDNLKRLGGGGEWDNRGTHRPLQNTQMAHLQSSYSDIAAVVREFTVNIEATRKLSGGNVDGGGLNFVDPFGGRPFSGQTPMAANLNTQGAPKVLGVMRFRSAPPITADAVMPHEERGVCTKCHSIIAGKSTVNQVAARAQQNRSSVGSGIIIDQAGFVLTNYHIICNAVDLAVTTANGNHYAADVRYTDVPGDLAILKINSVNKFPVARMGDSDLVQEGDIVLAVGNQFGLSQTVTSGIVSDTNRTVNIGGSPVAGLIQTDAAINRGSSGGPLVNIKGEVIGINTAIYSLTGDFTGIGFSIPVNRAKSTFGHIPAVTGMAANVFDLNVGEVITVAMVPDAPAAWFGAEVIGIDPILAEQFGLHSKKGVMVNRVFERSPASKAGIKRGDVIKDINGRRITDVRKFRKVVAPLMVGDTIDLIIISANQKVAVSAQLVEVPKKQLRARDTRRAAAAPIEMEWAGLEVVGVTPQAVKKFGIARGTRGVVVMEPEGMPAAAGIMMGDVITGINRKQISNMTDFSEVVNNINITDGVMFDILRRGEPLFITM